MEDEQILINQDVITNISDGTLFYPCSGYDYNFPIRVFAPFVSKFIFVDKKEYNDLNQDFQKISKFLSNTNICMKISSEISEKEVHKKKYYYHYNFVNPGIRKDKYFHNIEKKYFEIIYRRGYGIFGFNELVDNLDVFFYRGDSLGEGGSNAWWNTVPSITFVLYKLKDNGLFVTDGSNCFSAPYKFLNKSNISAYENRVQYVDPYANVFTCVGVLGHRYGTNFAWQVKKNPEFYDLKKTRYDLRRAKEKFLHIRNFDE